MALLIAPLSLDRFARDRHSAPQFGRYALGKHDEPRKLMPALGAAILSQTQTRRRPHWPALLPRAKENAASTLYPTTTTTKKGKDVSRERFLIILLTTLSFLSYALRMNISVAAQFMMPELGFTAVQMGQIFSAFMLGYALFQVPWGIVGDRIGPHRTMSAAILIWAVTTLLTGLVSGRAASAMLGFFLLWALRFVLGIGEAAMFPIAARAAASWALPTRRASVMAFVLAGAFAGAAATGPAIAALMVGVGWRESFYVAAAITLVVGGIWHFAAPAHSTHQPSAEQPVPSVVAKGRAVSETPHPPWWDLLKNRNLQLLCVSYFLNSYVLFVFVFWLYLYLVQQRGFGVLRSGFYTALPFIVASVFCPISGFISDKLVLRLGLTWGRRSVAAVCLVGSGIFLLVGVFAHALIPALLGLSLSVGLLCSTEPAFWSTSIDLAGTNVGASGGIMNMAGNLGGVVSTAAFPIAIRWIGWTAAFGVTAGLTFAAAALWFFISVRRRTAGFDAIAGAAAAQGLAAG